MGIGLRRLLLVILSIAGGIGLTFAILAGLNAAYGDVDIQRYGSIYAILTAVPLAVLVGIWLDYFMKTNLLSEGADAEKPSQSGESPQQPS